MERSEEYDPGCAAIMDHPAELTISHGDLSSRRHHGGAIKDHDDVTRMDHLDVTMADHEGVNTEDHHRVLLLRHHHATMTLMAHGDGTMTTAASQRCCGQLLNP